MPMSPSIVKWTCANNTPSTPDYSYLKKEISSPLLARISFINRFFDLKFSFLAQIKLFFVQPRSDPSFSFNRLYGSPSASLPCDAWQGKMQVYGVRESNTLYNRTKLIQFFTGKVTGIKVWSDIIFVAKP